MRQPLRVRLGIVAVAVALSLVPTAGAMALAPEPPAAELGARKTVDDFISFRAEFGLRTDRAFVERVTEVAPEWGVPLTASERSDLARRVAVQDSLDNLKTYQTSVSDAFGGMFIDQRSGGVLDIALTPQGDEGVMDTMRLLAPPNAILRFRTVSYSLVELEAIQAHLESIMSAGQPAEAIDSLVVNLVDNVLEVGIAEQDRASLAALLAPYGDRVRVVDPVIVRDAACISRSECTPYRAGLYIYRSDGSGAFCTGGFMSKKSTGANFWLTAGHCGPLNSTWFHDEGQVGNITIRSYAQNSAADAAGIALPGSQHNWIYVTNGEQARTVTARQGHDADTPGEGVCQSGWTTGFYCGLLYNDNATVTSRGVTFVRMRLASVKVQNGDSGGPAFYGNTAKGIVKGYVPGVYCGPVECGVYSHIWEVEQALGVTVLTQ